MSYEETLAYLYASQPAFHLVGAAAYKPGLENTYRLMEHLGNPHLHFRSVHIAGTNGKGSTSHLIAASLQAAGLKVGLYTSPHLVDFRERIRLNGQMIPEQYVVDFVAQNEEFLEEVHPSFFETTMALAFAYFADMQVDVAVIEVGLGGRLDSTNIITPMLSVITNIGFDHTEFLGDTLPKIASEKAGIIKAGVPCVVGESDPETAPVFLQKAAECGILGDGLETTDCRIWFADQCGYLHRCRMRDATDCQLHGIYQEKNTQTAYVALRVLQNYSEIGGHITTAAIRQGFAEVCTMTGLRGRWETVAKEPLTICDTGHNSHGLRYVAEQLERLQAEKKCTLHIVFGMVSDKDVDVVMHLLPTTRVIDGKRLEVKYCFVQPETHRAIPAGEMLSRWQNIHPEDTCAEAIPNIGEALQKVQSVANQEDIIFIGGSNYVVGAALKRYPREQRRWNKDNGIK